MKSIIVLGFGRSGTTWLSDIISKATGNLILFEPFHPSVTEFSRTFSYSYINDDNNTNHLKNYLCDVLNKRHRKKWLLRNHIPVRLEEINQDFLKMLWEECSIGGFKEIRANFLIRWIYENLDSKIVYIVRHPCAVVSSIKRRKNFWEFGWPETYELFLNKTLYSDTYSNHDFVSHIGVVENVKTDLEKYAVMWAITHAIVLPELKKLKLPLFYYENIYGQPFSSVKEILRYLGFDDIRIHPSYIFTPAMTSLKTLHGLYRMDKEISQKGSKLFWEEILSKEEVDMIMDIVSHFGIHLYGKSGFPLTSTYSFDCKGLVKEKPQDNEETR